MFKQLKKRLLQLRAKFPSKLFAKVFVGLFAFYLLFSYFAVDPLAKWLVPRIAEKSLASKASVGKVSFDPFRLKATIENLKLSKQNGEPLAGFDKLIVDLEASGMFNLAWKFKQIAIVAPKVDVAVSADGQLNWADLMAKLDEDKSPSSDTFPRLVIGHILVSQGKVTYSDENRPTPLKTTLTPLNFELKGFSTLPKDRGDYLISAKFAEQGGILKWKGDMGVNPVASKGVVALEGIKIAKMMQLVKGVTFPFTPSSGDIQTSFTYDFALPKTIPTLVLNNVTFGLSDVKGDLTQGGSLSLTHALLSTPRLEFIKNKQPELHIKDLDFKLIELSVNQGQDTQIILKESTATLPQFDLQMQDQLQLQFQDLNLKFSDFNINKGEQTLLALPSMDVNEVTFDLAANSAKINQIILPAGKVTAIRDSVGNVNWQQAFVASDTVPKADINPTANETDQESPTESKGQESQAAQTIPEQAMTFDIADVQLKNWTVSFEDQSFKQPLIVDVADFNLGFALAAPQGNIEINKLESNMTGITTKTAATSVATLDKLALSQGTVSVAEQKISAQVLALSGLKTTVIKDADASLNWAKIFEPIAAANTTSAVKTKKNDKVSNQPEWAVLFEKITVDNASIHVEDKSVATPVVLDIEKAKLEIQNASLDLKKSLPIKAAFRVKQGGRFSTKGKLTPSPLKIDLGLRLSKFSLKPFAPYVNQVALLKLDSGAADVSGRLSLKQKKAFALNFKGKFDVKNMALLEEADDAPFLSWDHLKSDSLNVSLSPDKLHMATLQIVKPAGKFIINEDKSMNVTRILRSEADTANAAPVTVDAPKEPAAPVSSNNVLDQMQSVSAPVAAEEKVIESPQMVDATPATDAFPVSIATVRIDNGALEFADLSLTPQFGTNIHSLSGVINGLSTKPSAVSQVELDGKVDDYGAARIRGSLQPFAATDFTDIKLKFTNLEMSRLTPYSGKFAGRRIDSGKLSVDLEYKIKQRKLTGKNKFIINKLKLGEKIESEDAADLPLDLAIAILEDSDGVIDLDLPIAGSLDDPKFSYGSIFWKAIRNVLTKIVTAPFRALGKLFGGGAEEFDGIAFEGGVAEIAPPELEKLAKVSMALSKRQGLSLGIVPSYDVALDALAMQKDSYRRQVAEEMDIELTEGQLPGPVDLANENTQKAVTALHDDLTKKGLFKKLVSKFEEPEEGYFEKAQEALIASVEVSDADLQVLAKARGEAIQKTLIDAGIDADRISMEKVVKVTAKDKVVKTKLTLDVKKLASPASSAAEVPATESQVPEAVATEAPGDVPTVETQP